MTSKTYGESGDEHDLSLIIPHQLHDSYSSKKEKKKVFSESVFKYLTTYIGSIGVLNIHIISHEKWV